MGEVEVLKKLQHPNIISLHHAFLHQGALYIVMEFADAGDLSAVSIMLSLHGFQASLQKYSANGNSLA